MPVALQPNDIHPHFPQYHNITPIKSGGYKSVYRVETTSGIEALKIITLPVAANSPDDDALHQEIKGRVNRELEALQRCACPELVRLATFTLTEMTINNLPVLAYSEEYLAGKDLWEIWRNDPTQPSESELKILFGVLLRAIRQLWGSGYIHRDIKPANIIKLSDPQRPFVLLDLGIAFSINDTALTADSQRFPPPATLRYIAPEMIRPNFRENLDYRSDLYTAALTVYEYGAKTHPIARDREDAMQTISRAINEEPKPLIIKRSDLSAEFCQLIDQMLKKIPALRPANLNLLISRMEAGI